MHSSAACDPLSDQAKAMKKVSSLRKKTDEDHMELSRLDWLAAFYGDEAGRPIIPADNFSACLLSGAKKLKLGTEFKAGAIVLDDGIITGHGHKLGAKATVEDFWADRRFVFAKAVRVMNGRVMRYRPIFRSWETTLKVEVFDITADQVTQSLNIAGRMCGIGDWRPRYGSFTADLVSQEE